MVLGGGVAVGIYIAIHYKKRVRELWQLEHSFIYISGELQYRHSILADLFGQVAKRSGNILSKWFLSLQNMLSVSNVSSVHDVWTQSLDELRSYSNLHSSDFAILESVGMLLGCVDLDTQLKEIAVVTEQLHDVRLQAEHNLTAKMKVVITLCSVAAILLVILFL